MSHDYNTRTKKQKDENNMLVALANLETELLDGFSSLKDEVISLKDVITRNLQEENAKLRSRFEVLENKFNHLEEYGRRCNIELSEITDSIGGNKLECSVIKVMKAIDIEVDDRDIETCHSKQKLASVNTSAAGLGNSTKLFIRENLTDYNNKLAFKCGKLKSASLVHSTFTRDGVVHIMKSDHSKYEKNTHMSKVVKLFPDFEFRDEKSGS